MPSESNGNSFDWNGDSAFSEGNAYGLCGNDGTRPPGSSTWLFAVGPGRL
jgi:hypothetical protein